MDMPLRGINWKDQKPGLIDHEDFETYATNWTGTFHPLGLFLEPVSHVVDLIYQQATAEPLILMAGRSGGGWATLWYSALDPRIDLAVVIAGFTPLSMRDRPTLDGGLVKPGDWEQNVPSIYDYVSYEDLVELRADRPTLYLYGQYDPCCFNVAPDEPYTAWLRSRGGVFVDPTWDQHGVSPAQYQVWSSVLRWVGK
jgi:pimeloyl-ACP methyl ester carboxylesterase